MPDTSLPIETRQKALAAPPERIALPPPQVRPPELPPVEPPVEAPVRTRRRRGWLLWVLVVVAAGAAAWWYWPQLTRLVTGQPAATTAVAPGANRPGAGARGRGGRGGGGPVPVTVAAATRRDIPLLLDALGTVQALNTITLRSQVDGILVEIAFTEGQEVKRGDVLARIDPRTYAAALAQAEAKKAQDEAVLANARVDLQRYTDLARVNGATRQQLDTQRATVAQNEALVQADEAAAQSARTQLSFTTIRSPVDGRVGIRLVDQGNLVHAGDAGGIVVVTQVRPISVLFTLPQQELPRILTAMAAGPVEVQALAADGSVRARGTVLTPDNQVDQSTGTIKLKATFANADQALWPGAFVNVRLLAETVRGATAIPLVAVQRGPDGAYAFVLKPDNTVEQRPLTLGVLTATDAVVLRGLNLEEKVVTSGALRLNPGSQVQVMEPAPAATGPAAPAGGQGRGPRGNRGAGTGNPPGNAPGNPPGNAPGNPPGNVAGAPPANRDAPPAAPGANAEPPAGPSGAATPPAAPANAPAPAGAPTSR